MRDPFQKFEQDAWREVMLCFGGGSPPPPPTIIQPPPPPPPPAPAPAPAVDQAAIDAAVKKQTAQAAQTSGRASTFLSNQSGRMSTILTGSDKLGA